MSVILVVQYRSFLDDIKWIRWQFNILRPIAGKYFRRLKKYKAKTNVSKKYLFSSLEFNAGISSTLWHKWQWYNTLPEKKTNKKESEKLCKIVDLRSYPASVIQFNYWRRIILLRKINIK